MAFLPYSYENGQPCPFEYHKLAEAGDIQIGLCMALEDGKAAISAKPDYICLRDEENAAADTLVPLMHISADVVFEAPLAADAAALTPGSLCDVSADGLAIAATGTNKNIQIITMDGTAEGDLCRCRFV